MGLAAHLGRLEGDDVEDGAVDGKEHVEGAFEVVLGELVGEVGDVETMFMILRSALAGRQVDMACS